MTSSLKELLIVLAIGAAVFHFAKPIALRFSTGSDFARRRNVWFILTATAFLSPNFWWFALVAMPLLTWGGWKDSNPIGFYLLLLQLVPSIPVEIPTIGINELFNLDIYRLLSLCVLIPAVWRLRQSKNPARIRGVHAMDFLLIAYGALQVALFVRPDLPNHLILQDSPTAALRRAFLFFVDVYSLYFVVSRSCLSRRTIIDAMAAFCLSCTLIAPMAVFENLRHWPLFMSMSTRWSGQLPIGFYIIRNGALRAQVSTGDPLALGYLLAIAFGFWMYLQSHVKATLSSLIAVLLLWLGLLAAYSRGPWLGAVAIYFTLAALGPRALPRFLKAIGVAVLVSAVILLSPLGDKIIEVLPFMGGSVDSGSILYRQRLAERSWQLIQQHPFLGDQFVYSKMEDLRQGQGIIDLVNTYAQVTLFYGVVGLSLFLSPFLLGLYKAHRLARKVAQSDVDLARLGVSLVACMLGTLVMISTCSFILGYAKIYYVLAGLATAYAHLAPLKQQGIETYVHSTTRPPSQRSAPVYARIPRRRQPH